MCFLTTINLTFKFQLMVHEKLSWRNCKCPVDLWQPGQIVLKKFHPSKNPGCIYASVNKTITWSDNGLSPVQCKAIIWINAGLLLFGPLRINFSEISQNTSICIQEIVLENVLPKWHPFCLCLNVLTHWGRVTHICVSNLTIIGSDNGLSPGRRQAIIWTNAGILLIGLSGTNFSEILIEIHIFWIRKCI